MILGGLASALVVSVLALVAGAAPVLAEETIQPVIPLFKAHIEDCGKVIRSSAPEGPAAAVVFEMASDLTRYKGECVQFPSIAVQLNIEDALGLRDDEKRTPLFVKVSPDLVKVGLWDEVRFPDLAGGVPLDFAVSTWGSVTK